MLVKEITQRITFHGFDLKPGFFWGKLQNGTEFVITSVFVPGCVEEERPEEASARVFIRAKSGDWEETEWYASDREEQGELVLDIAYYLCESPHHTGYLPSAFWRSFFCSKRNKKLQQKKIRREKCKAFWLVSADGHEQNSFADSNTCHDGGGYFQPAGKAVFCTNNGTKITVYMSDFSCGDIGIRRNFTIKICGESGESWDISENTMGGYDSTPSDYDQIYLAVKAASGVNLYALLRAARYKINNAACADKQEGQHGNSQNKSQQQI